MESLELINDIAEESRPRRVSSLFMVRSASRARMVGCAMFAAAGFLVFATVLIATRPRGAVADICKTKSCGTLAAELVKTMNTSADPCTVRTRYEQLRLPNSSSCSPCSPPCRPCSCTAVCGRVFRSCRWLLQCCGRNQRGKGCCKQMCSKAGTGIRASKGCLEMVCMHGSTCT